MEISSPGSSGGGVAGGRGPQDVVHPQKKTGCNNHIKVFFCFSRKTFIFEIFAWGEFKQGVFVSQGKRVIFEIFLGGEFKKSRHVAK